MPRPRLRDDALRRRLLEGAIELLADDGANAVTTRAVATSAGTSLPAVNELFGGKQGLVRAIFATGFAELAAALDAAGRDDDPIEAILQLARAFRRFAAENPHLFEVMFSRPFAEFEPDDEDHTAAVAVHDAVMDRVTALLGTSVPLRARKDAAIALFALVRGLAELELAGILGSGPTSAERRWRGAVLALVHGLNDHPEDR